jgi:hypothetical protein
MVGMETIARTQSDDGALSSLDRLLFAEEVSGDGVEGEQ